MDERRRGRGVGPAAPAEDRAAQAEHPPTGMLAVEAVALTVPRGAEGEPRCPPKGEHQRHHQARHPAGGDQFALRQIPDSALGVLKGGLDMGALAIAPHRHRASQRIADQDPGLVGTPIPMDGEEDRHPARPFEEIDPTGPVVARSRDQIPEATLGSGGQAHFVTTVGIDGQAQHEVPPGFQTRLHQAGPTQPGIGNQGRHYTWGSAALTAGAICAIKVPRRLVHFC